MKIGIANDVPMAVEALRRCLAQRPEHEIIWIARDGAQAVEACVQHAPDLILMDLMMPVMDGVEATRRIMSTMPCAILVVTMSVDGNSARVFEAMGHGAIDAVDTPALGQADSKATAAAFLKKIDTISKLIGTRRFIPSPDLFGETWTIKRSDRLVVIGASAGGPAALATLLSGLPRDFGAAIVVVQHVDERFASGMAAWLSRESPLPVRVAQEGDRPAIGAVLLAGTNDHLKFKTADRLGYAAEPRDYAYRPSVDVFFESVNALWSGEVVAILLTGMGRDGAKGLKSLRSRGHYTIAQDQGTSAVYGMPKAAATLGAAVDILPVGGIAARLIETFKYKF